MRRYHHEINVALGGIVHERRCWFSEEHQRLECYLEREIPGNSVKDISAFATCC
jgi:hypothetical protein